MVPRSKWKFAIGTTSRVPDSRGLHYLIADFDGPMINSFNLHCLIRDYKTILQATPHGWHLYTNRIMTFDRLTDILISLHADPAWVRIGAKRGYFFLADKKEIKFSWPVEHMVLHHGKEKTQNS